MALFMVIERFRNGDPAPIYDRFAQCGRMMPDDVQYVNSWISQDRTICYQVMEAARAEDLQPWMDKWSDLMEFTVVPVMTSAEAVALAAADLA
ncbi:MAG: DUF3303 family protein [Chthonomonas sp.]|nr:DUF3303 family protein [Chthonomonas sp.]